MVHEILEHRAPTATPAAILRVRIEFSFLSYATELPELRHAADFMSTSDNQELVLAYRTADMVEARSLAAHLEDAEIDTQVIGDFRDTAYPGLFVGSMADKELWVSKSNQAAAEAIVGEWRRTHHPMDLAPARGFHFSLKSLLIALSIAAIAFAIVGRSPLSVIAGVSLNLGIFVLYFYFAWRRLQQKRLARDDDETAPSEMTV